MRCVILHRVLSTAAFIGLLSVTSVAAELIPPWDLLDKEFTYSPSSLSQFTNESSHFRYLLTNQNIEAFTEMTAQGKPIGLRLVGFQGLLALDHQRGLEAGLKIALTEAPGFGMAEVYLELAKLPSGPQGDQSLTEAFRTIPVRTDSAAGLMLQLPRARLQKWFEAPNRGWVVPSYEALVLRELYSEFRAKKEPPTERMKTTLAKFVAIPGVPRVEFLVHADESHPLYKRAMELVLEDNSLVGIDLQRLVASKATYISEHIDLAGLRLSDARRNDLRGYLEEIRK
jgi:hypothetical protein